MNYVYIVLRLLYYEKFYFKKNEFNILSTYSGRVCNPNIKHVTTVHEITDEKFAVCLI